MQIRSCGEGDRTALACGLQLPGVCTDIDIVLNTRTSNYILMQNSPKQAFEPPFSCETLTGRHEILEDYQVTDYILTGEASQCG